MPITKGFQALVDEAMEEVKTYSVESVKARLNDAAVQIVDIRDVRELERDGTVVGAYPAPRGMLEFWVDPAGGVIEVRSASRLGREDFGVNRQRIDAVRAAYLAAAVSLR